MYPILNTFHRILANVFIFITIIYVFQVISEKVEIKEKHKKIINFTEWIIIIAVIGYSVLNIYRIVIYFRMYNRENNIYYGGIYREGQKENINNVCNYIKTKEKQGIRVIFISYKAMLYNSILEINNVKLDLPFVGNLGKEGEDGLINDISKLKNTEILITKNEEEVVQESKKALEFVRNTYKKIGEIEEFYIYKTEE